MPWIVSEKKFRRKEQLVAALLNDPKGINAANAKISGGEFIFGNVAELLERTGEMTLTTIYRRWFVTIHKGTNGQIHVR